MYITSKLIKKPNLCKIQVKLPKIVYQPILSMMNYYVKCDCKILVHVKASKLHIHVKSSQILHSFHVSLIPYAYTPNKDKRGLIISLYAGM